MEELPLRGQAMRNGSSEIGGMIVKEPILDAVKNIFDLGIKDP